MFEVFAVCVKWSDGQIIIYSSMLYNSEARARRAINKHNWTIIGTNSGLGDIREVYPIALKVWDDNDP